MPDTVITDTSTEMRRLQHDLMMRLGTNRRVELAAEMHMAARAMIVSSMPAGASEKEIKREIFRKTYGEELPGDFFKDGEE